MDNGRRSALLRKYLSLGLGELTAAVVFTFVAVIAVQPRLTSDRERLALWSALIPLLVILVQAGMYWLVARTWVARSKMPRGLARAYRVLGWVDAALLVAGLVAIVAWHPQEVGTMALVAAVWAFGVVEYVNYFAVRLAYPVGRWFRSVVTWRTPQLVQDIRASSDGVPLG